jgi:hypothetical protein
MIFPIAFTLALLSPVAALCILSGLVAAQLASASLSPHKD